MLFVIALCAFIGLASSQNFCPNFCGQRTLAPAGDVDYDKIVGGVESVPNSWPWSCSFRSNGGHICGASLISQNAAVTAAHCVSATANPNTYTLVCGSHVRLQNDPWTKIYRVLRLVRHPSYDARVIKNDIAVIILTENAVFNQYISPVCYPDVSDTYAGKQSVATGWGSLFSGGGSAARHQEVSMPILTDARCEQRFDGTNNMLEPTTQVCAGEVGQGKDTCQGDSGGPLVVKHDDDNLWYLCGLTSWGYGCGDGGVYTRASTFRPWVVSQGVTLPTGKCE